MTMSDVYIRSDDGALMVRLAPHQFVSAEYGLKNRTRIGGRFLTRETVDDMMAALTTADAAMREAAE